VTIPRSEIIDESEPGTYHLRSRCVRRAFLCGKDRYSGIDYEYRRVWIEERLRYLTEPFTIDLLAYAIMSNHMHLTARNRPDIARGAGPRGRSRSGGCGSSRHTNRTEA